MQESPKEFEKIKLGGYDWLVLEKQSNKALVLSEIVIEQRRYHYAKGDITWAECDLRNYLNNHFYYNAFDKKESARIWRVAGWVTVSVK